MLETGVKIQAIPSSEPGACRASELDDIPIQSDVEENLEQNVKFKSGKVNARQYENVETRDKESSQSCEQNIKFKSGKVNARQYENVETRDKDSSQSCEQNPGAVYISLEPANKKDRIVPTAYISIQFDDELQHEAA